MSKQPPHSPHSQIYACLPFVELAHEASIQIGPVTFWPSSKYLSYIESGYQSTFEAYIQSIGQIKAKCEEQTAWVNTIKLSLRGTTCVSLSNTVPQERREALLIDSLHLLYFACTFKDIYYGNEIPSFNGFRKIIPCSLDFIQSKQNWEHLYIDETYREETVCIHLFDKEICQGLGKTLSVIYEGTADHDPLIIHGYIRLIRSIRYLVDRFFQRFVNLFQKGIAFSDELFEPEDVIFLASSFEALFDINDKDCAADFKHKLRPLLHLKYSKPLELFWKWVDDFYEVRRRIVHGGLAPDHLFRINPNFEISHLLIGIKLFIYSAYYTLNRYQLLGSSPADSYTPPDFKWIHPEEVLLFFWTEESILNKLIVYIKQAQKEPSNEEAFSDIHLLTTLFVSLYERYFRHPQHPNIRFLPTPLSAIQQQGMQILEILEKEKKEKREYKEEKPFKVVAPRFVSSLKKRLER